MARRPIRTICRRAVDAADTQGVWVRLPTQTQLHLDCPSPTSRSYGKPLFPSLSGVVSPSPEDRRFGAIPRIHLWEKGTPSAHHRQEPYSAEQAIAGMDEAGVDRALVHPVLWDPDSNELAVEAIAPANVELYRAG